MPDKVERKRRYEITVQMTELPFSSDDPHWDDEATIKDMIKFSLRDAWWRTGSIKVKRLRPEEGKGK